MLPKRLKPLVFKPCRHPKLNQTLRISGFWDPVGYTRDGSVETFKRRRETEIKHGRVAMYVAGSQLVLSWGGARKVQAFGNQGCLCLTTTVESVLTCDPVLYDLRQKTSLGRANFCGNLFLAACGYFFVFGSCDCASAHLHFGARAVIVCFCAPLFASALLRYGTRAVIICFCAVAFSLPRF